MNAVQVVCLGLVSVTGMAYVLLVWLGDRTHPLAKAALYANGAVLILIGIWGSTEIRASTFGVTPIFDPGHAFWVSVLAVETAAVVLGIALPTLLPRHRVGGR